MMGYCLNTTAQIVTNEELNNRNFITDMLTYAQSLNLSPSTCRDYLIDAYAAFEGRIINRNGEEVFIDLELFEVDDDVLFEPLSVGGAAKQVSVANNSIRQWFDYWLCGAIIPNERTELSPMTRERFRVIATILKADNPQEAQFWGIKNKAANDN